MSRSVLIDNTSPTSPTPLVPIDSFNFSERMDNEQILAIIRPHWFTNVPWVITVLVLAFAPFVVTIFSLLDFLPNFKFHLVIGYFWYLVVFAFAFEKFISWYFDVYLITNLRIIDFDFHNLLDRKFSEARIQTIQDISFKLLGTSQTLFNYGSIKIQTAGQNPEIDFERIANPEKITKLLQELCQKNDSTL